MAKAVFQWAVVLAVVVLLFTGIHWAVERNRRLEYHAAFERGRQAREAGATAEANPYGNWNDSKSMRAAWLDGWVAGAVEEEGVADSARGERAEERAGGGEPANSP